MGQVLYPPAVFPIPFTSTIAASGSWSSGLMFNDGYRYLTVALTMTTAGTLNIQQYLDLAGTIPRGAVNTSPIVAATALIVDIADMKPFVTFTIQILNSGGAATVSSFQVILSAG